MPAIHNRCISAALDIDHCTKATCAGGYECFTRMPKVKWKAPVLASDQRIIDELTHVSRG